MTLSAASILIGGVLGTIYVLMVTAPETAMGWFRRFPRSRVAAALLSVICFAWCVWLLHITPMGQFEWVRRPLYVLLPVICLLIILLNDELLAVRGLGGLLLLIPSPLLAMARVEPSNWRYVVLVLGYGMVIKGMAFIMSPHTFRRGAELLVPSPGACRAWGAVGLVVSVLLVTLGLSVF